MSKENIKESHKYRLKKTAKNETIYLKKQIKMN